MAVHNHIEVNFEITPPPPEGTHLAVNLSPIPLFESGFNLAVEVSTASAFRSPPLNAPLSSITVTAHFDTGATFTAIDINLARHLNLLAIGQSEHHTAAGRQTMPNFAVDISFLNTRLSPIYNLRISSCNLGFALKNNASLPNPQNMGLLIGRDIMSRWNIIWNGPTSTVIVSD